MNSKVLVLLAVLGGGFFFLNSDKFGSGGSAGGDPQTATAAVSLAGGVVDKSDGNSPTPNPAPGPKPPRKDCKYCNGTGFITHGDGHKSPCPHCESKDDLFSKKSKSCCKHCDCGPGCTCTYPGQCLVEANGGEPVEICDPEDGECYIYSDPNKDFAKAESQPPVPQTDPVLDALVEKGRVCFAAKDYKGALAVVRLMEKELVSKPDNATYAAYRKKALHARMNLDKKMASIDKETYQKFIDDYNGYLERNNSRLAELLKYKQAEASNGSCENGSCGYNQGSSFSTGSCSGGGCGTGWGSNSFRRWGEGRPSYQYDSFAPPNNFGGHGVYYGGGGCSGGSCGGGGCSSCN